jgi:orotidine-5'-phosphate decarboxylase
VTESCVIVALDFPDATSALAMADRLTPAQCKVKVGKELFTVAGPNLVEKLVSRGFKVFLDLKFHDIPQTVARACAAAARMGVWMMNVHASGGRAMLLAAREAVAASEARLIAVTVLTSLDAHDLREVGISAEPAAQVQRLALLARDCGLDGVVCSAQEARQLREACGDRFLLVTPGIRLASSAADDQKRVMTPTRARLEGADYLVIGRPITEATDPDSVLQKINLEITEARA